MVNMMPGPEFFQTTMGQRFYEGTVPKLTHAVERVADLLEKVTESAANEADLFNDKTARNQLIASSNKQTPDYTLYAKTARQYYHDGGTVEIDDEPIVSTILDDEENIVGAYVQAWVWVDKPVGEQDAGDE